MFLIPKQGEEQRPIINLKPLNCYIKTKDFRTKTITDVSQILQEGDWAVTLDLKDAYFQVPIHPRHLPFLQFTWRGQNYRYNALPFSL
ncbi:hypothetical protein ACOMHN_020247 [Nucella lapillus]